MNDCRRTAHLKFSVICGSITYLLGGTMARFISIEDAFELLKADQEDVLFLDVRDRQAFQQSHIQGAQHLTDNTLDQICSTMDRARPIIVYCYHGLSSVDAVDYLLSQGFHNVASLEG